MKRILIWAAACGLAAAVWAPAAQDGGLPEEQADRLLATGRAAFEDGLHRLASRRLEELAAGAPDPQRRAEAALWLARVRRAEDRPAEALAVLAAHAGGAETEELLAACALEQARAESDLGRWTEAEERLQGFDGEWAEMDTAPAARELRIRILAAEAKWQEALDACRDLQADRPEHPATPAASLELARALGSAGRRDEAAGLLEWVRSRADERAWREKAVLQLAELELADGDRMQALARLEKLAGDPNLLAETRARGYRLAAEALETDGKYGPALQLIERGIAAAADPGLRLENEIVKARLLIGAGQADEGRALMRSVATRVPDPGLAARVQRELAVRLAEQGRPEAAAEEYQIWLDAFEGTDGTADVLADFARLRLDAGRPGAAADLFTRAALAEPDAERGRDLRQQLADAQFAAGRFEAARATYGALLQELTGDGAAVRRIRYQTAEAELALGETEAAEARLRELARLPEADALSRRAVMRLGALYEERGALETAAEEYGRLIEGCGGTAACAPARLARGLIRYRAGDFPAALEDFTRLCEDHPDAPEAARGTFMQGWCLHMLGRDDEALAACERFLADYPDSVYVPDVLFWLGEHAFNEGRYEQAEERFAGLAQTHPDSSRAADALFWAGRAATARRAYLAANEHYNALMADYPDSDRLPEALLAQGDVLSELGQFPAAILAFGEVIVRYPQSPQAMMAWGRKGDCQYTLGQENPARYEEALLSYRTLLDFTGAPPDLRLQAGYKIGRTLEKMGRATAALDRYMDVSYSFLLEPAPPAEATVWFTRATFAAAALQERAGRWKEAVNIYQRVADSGVPAAAEALDRVQRIRKEHWVEF